MMRAKKLAISLVFATGVGAFLAGCSDDNNGPKVDPGVVFYVKPESLRECAPPSVVTLTWDAAAAGLNTVRIFAEDRIGKKTLFAEQGRAGAASTGAWATPGMTFTLESADGTRTVGKLLIKPEKC